MWLFVYFCRELTEGLMPDSRWCSSEMYTIVWHHYLKAGNSQAVVYRVPKSEVPKQKSVTDVTWNTSGHRTSTRMVGIDSQGAISSSMQYAGLGTRGTGTCRTGTAGLGQALQGHFVLFFVIQMLTKFFCNGM